MNSSWSRLSGYAREELVGRPLAQFLPGLATAPTGRDEIFRRYQMIDRRGHRTSLRLVEHRFEDLELADCVALVAVEAAANQALRLISSGGAETRAERTLGSLDDAIVRTDRQGRVDFLNPAAQTLLHLGDEAIGKEVAEILQLFDEPTGESIENPVAAALASGSSVLTAERSILRRRDGLELAVHARASPLFDAQNAVDGAVLVLRDISRTRALERELNFLATHDSVTGLTNRREFERQLTEALITAQLESREHALLYLDLDHFKLVNDTCGHLAGDEMLRRVSELLHLRLRRGDFLARLGGDEFGVLLFDCEPDAARAIADEIRHLIRSFRFEWEGNLFEFGVSIGLVPIHKGSGEITDILRAADTACYVVKDSGGNGVHGFSLDDTAIGLRQGEMRWIERLHRALEEDRLRLHFQQIERMKDGSRPMCELFLRLVERNGTVHSASSFIAAAERFGLMVEIDRWVVRKAFAALAEASRNRDTPFRFADNRLAPIDCFTINLSAHSISNPSFLDFTLDEFKSSGVDPKRVCFEITETAAIRNLERARLLIVALREIGCRFALDDFGRGLSSLAYLRELKVDLLKIDGEFIRGLALDPVCRAMVASFHQIARVMGIATIGEGVEDAATHQAMREIGIDYAQGFHMHRPEALIYDR